MSLLSKKPILIPSGVTVEDKNGMFVVTGAQGSLQLPKLPGVSFIVAPESIDVKASDENRQSRMNEGTMWSLLKNALEGVSKGFSKVLEIEGVGFKAAVEGTALVLSLGFAHPVKMEIPKDLKVTVEKKIITIQGFDKELVGKFASQIRAKKKPEPYKGKGIKYQNEVIRRKAGKKAATGSA